MVSAAFLRCGGDMVLVSRVNPGGEVSYIPEIILISQLPKKGDIQPGGVLSTVEVHRKSKF